jgi:hypothetical protein
MAFSVSPASNLRISRSGWMARHSNDRFTTVPGVFREADFLYRVRLDKEYQRWSHESFSRPLGRACPYFASSPAKDSEHDPTD